MTNNFFYQMYCYYFWFFFLNSHFIASTRSIRLWFCLRLQFFRREFATSEASSLPAWSRSVRSYQFRSCFASVSFTQTFRRGSEQTWQATRFRFFLSSLSPPTSLWIYASYGNRSPRGLCEPLHHFSISEVAFELAIKILSACRI